MTFKPNIIREPKDVDPEEAKLFALVYKKVDDAVKEIAYSMDRADEWHPKCFTVMSAAMMKIEREMIDSMNYVIQTETDIDPEAVKTLDFVKDEIILNVAAFVAVNLKLVKDEKVKQYIKDFIVNEGASFYD